ncbi:unnamed protein product [Acanthoscelides obtectus]|uniref:Uncharacterized protein n=1 Tax=Acanthoscelides obtectus TaxID=200917 RepID=A0A9P0PX57_ACAOB|nr:unnamed protein product [Acanthoscelides obtectus]CAK1681147.1 hypothetical protein AOBTE_LOCUS33035 [Acanthoscelides obtectus]
MFRDFVEESAESCPQKTSLSSLRCILPFRTKVVSSTKTDTKKKRLGSRSPEGSSKIGIHLGRKRGIKNHNEQFRLRHFRGRPQRI